MSASSTKVAANESNILCWLHVVCIVDTPAITAIHAKTVLGAALPEQAIFERDVLRPVIN
jgi:hypothetical protein